MKKIIVLVLISLVMFVSMAYAAPKYTIKVACIDSESHPTIVTLRKYFVPMVENGSNGQIKVEVYPNGQLGADREVAEAAQLGTIQIAIVASANLSGFANSVQVLELPYLFTSRKAAFEAVDGILGKKLNSDLAQKGLSVLGYMENGFRHVTNNKKPIRVPADLKGVKLRVQEIPMHIAYFKAVGANPAPLSWSELYTALQQGTMDAQENPYVMIVDGKLYETQKYVSETGHVFAYEMYVANKKFIDSLPADLKKLVIDAVKETTMQQRKAMVQEEVDCKAKCEKAGMKINTLTPAEKQEFVKLTAKVYPMFEKDLGKELMEIIKKVQK